MAYLFDPSNPINELPDDPQLLKECLRELSSLVGIHLLEKQFLKEEINFLKHENQKLIRVLCPAN